MFKKSDGTYDGTKSCLGNDTTILLERKCSVTFLTFRSDFGLVLDNLIVAKIRAYNSFGWGLFNENIEGALIKTEPKKPPSKIRRDVLTDLYRVHIKWFSLIDEFTGREPILSYEI